MVNKQTPKKEITKRVNLQGYINKRSGKKVGPYKKTFKKYPNHYFTELIDPNTGQPRLAEVWVKGKQRRSRWVEDKRKAKLISLAMAKEAFERQPQKAKSKDLIYRAKKVFDQDAITTAYLTNPGRSDVEALDTPPSKKVEEKETEIKQEEKKEITPENTTFKKIDFERKFENLVELTIGYQQINELLYTPENLTESQINKLKERREELLKIRETVKTSQKVEPFNYSDSSKGIYINEREGKVYVGFDYNTYSKLPENVKQEWRSCARWDKINKTWTLYSNKKENGLDLLFKKGLISKKPESSKTLSDLYLSPSEKKKKTIIIEIDDENKIAKMDGDYETLKKIDNFYSYYMKGYKYSQAYKEGEWDGKIHILSLSNRALPKNLAYNIMENKNEIDPELDLKIVDFRRNAVRDKSFKLKDIKLYDYQEDAINKAVNEKQGLVVVATGGGKTEIASGIIAEYGSDNDTIFLVHTTALQDQAEERLEKRLGINVGVGGGVRHDIKDTSLGDVNVVTLQSLHGALKDQKEKKELSEKQKELLKAYMDAELVIQDESHHVKADTFKETIDASETKHLIGLTATPYRDENDEKEVYSRFGKKIVDIPVDILISKGKLVPPTINIINIPATRTAKEVSMTYKPGTQKYNAIKNAQVINNEERNNLIKDLAIKQEKVGKTNLIFVDRIAHGKKLAKLLNKPFLNGQDQTEKTRKKNQEIISKVAKGEVKTIIATQQLFGEGFDLPAIDSLIIADAGGMSKVKTMQRAGRALRTKEGKKVTEIYDFKDNIEYLGEHADMRIGTYKENKEFTVKELSTNDIK